MAIRLDDHRRGRLPYTKYFKVSHQAFSKACRGWGKAPREKLFAVPHLRAESMAARCASNLHFFFMGYMPYINVAPLILLKRKEA